MTEHKLGVSSDSKFITKFSQVHPQSASIFGKHNLSKENLSSMKPSGGLNAGLSFSNSHHKFYCYNGHVDKPKIFANFIRNSNVK